MSSAPTIHTSTKEVTTLLSEVRCRPRGTSSALTTAPIPKVADRSPKPPAPSSSWSRAMTGISASTALAHRQKLTLWTMSARIGGECRVYRRPLSMPDISVSGIARWARAGLFQPRIATIITTKKSAQPTSALPELSHATAAPASAGPTARATLKATAPRATARGISMRATRSLMLADWAGR